jgi:hypothetical protein
MVLPPRTIGAISQKVNANLYSMHLTGAPGTPDIDLDMEPPKHQIKLNFTGAGSKAVDDERSSVRRDVIYKARLQRDICDEAGNVKQTDVKDKFETQQEDKTISVQQYDPKDIYGKLLTELSEELAKTKLKK